MLNSITEPTQAAVLEKGIYASSLRHKVLSNNIANVNTPKFKRSDVSFEGYLQSSLADNGKKLPLARTNEKHLNASGGFTALSVNAQSAYSIRTDGNNVDIDSEMAEMAKNTIYYDAVTQQLSRYYSGIKNAIREGK